MALDVNQLRSSLDKSLAPAYLVSGDEPLQQSEAVDLIRQAARANGFLNRDSCKKVDSKEGANEEYYPLFEDFEHK